MNKNHVDPELDSACKYGVSISVWFEPLSVEFKLNSIPFNFIRLEQNINKPIYSPSQYAKQSFETYHAI